MTIRSLRTSNLAVAVPTEVLLHGIVRGAVRLLALEESTGHMPSATREEWNSRRMRSEGGDGKRRSTGEATSAGWAKRRGDVETRCLLTIISSVPGIGSLVPGCRGAPLHPSESFRSAASEEARAPIAPAAEFQRHERPFVLGFEAALRFWVEAGLAIPPNLATSRPPTTTPAITNSE